jgi:hypothetical protein
VIEFDEYYEWAGLEYAVEHSYELADFEVSSDE